jgi:hypothetical protein
LLRYLHNFTLGLVCFVLWPGTLKWQIWGLGATAPGRLGR